MRSFSAKAVSVTFPTQVIEAEAVPNSTPSSKGPPPTSVTVPPEYLNTLKRPPMLALMLDSSAHRSTSVVVRVNPPDGTRPEIHPTEDPPAVFVSRICVPDAVVFVTAVSTEDPAVMTMSYRFVIPPTVIPLSAASVVFLKNNLVAIYQGLSLSYHLPTV
jgi:hypothetical protein